MAPSKPFEKEIELGAISPPSSPVGTEHDGDTMAARGPSPDEDESKKKKQRPERTATFQDYLVRHAFPSASTRVACSN